MPDAARKPVPSPDDVARIASACERLAVAYEENSPIMEGVEPWRAAIPRLALLDALRDLEICFNPARRARDATGRAWIVAHWPTEVLGFLDAVRMDVEALIDSWDVPEICDDRVMFHGRGGRSVPRPDGGVDMVEFDRAPRPYEIPAPILKRLRLARTVLGQANVPDVTIRPILNPNGSEVVTAQRWDDMATIRLNVAECIRHDLQPDPPVSLFHHRPTGEWFECFHGRIRFWKQDDSGRPIEGSTYEESGWLFRQVPPEMARALCDRLGKVGFAIPAELRSVAVPEWAREASVVSSPGVSPPAELAGLLAAAPGPVGVDCYPAELESTRPTPARPARPAGYEERATAAAYAILKSGETVSIAAVCRRANLNRSHLMNRYPRTVEIIKRIAAKGREPRRGRKSRDGHIEAIDDAG